jgi:TusA-related sulfurtransferase
LAYILLKKAVRDRRMENKQKKRNIVKISRSESKVNHFLDLRGMIIPLTLLKITQAFRNIKPGETMDIVGTDPDTKRDFLKILGTSPYEVLHIKDERHGYLIRLRKGRI